MKISLSACALAVSALLTGYAVAADSPRSDAPKDGPRGIMRADADGDGKVSKDEAAALHDKKEADWFARTDLNQDGFLTEDEVRQARATRQQHRRDEMQQRGEQRFKDTDINGDGQISLDEAQARSPKLAERFTALDADKNGFLGKDELKRGGPGRAKPQN